MLWICVHLQVNTQFKRVLKGQQSVKVGSSLGLASGCWCEAEMFDGVLLQMKAAILISGCDPKHTKEMGLIINLRNLEVWK